jgi:Fic family protein
MPKETLEARWRVVETKLAKADPEFRADFDDTLEMSWVFHDAALEGSVYNFSELRTAMDPSIAIVPDSTMQPVCEEIRRHRDAIRWVRDFASKKRQTISVDVLKRIYLILHPEEGDLKSLKYRRDIPQHRLYFHEYAPPDKIATRLKQIFEWLDDPSQQKGRTALKVAARVHYDIVRCFPFQTNSGKVARLFLNLLLLRNGYPPAIVHHTERQRYYESLKGSPNAMSSIIADSMENGLQSAEKRLEEYETRTRAFVT